MTIEARPAQGHVLFERTTDSIRCVTPPLRYEKGGSFIACVREGQEPSAIAFTVNVKGYGPNRGGEVNRQKIPAGETKQIGHIIFEGS